MTVTMAVILAGGKGSRLEPLTRDRAKPAVPFGGAYRIIDFTLSNCLNSGLRQLLVFTQYKAASLDRHINLAWQQYFCRELGEFVDVIPPQQRIDDHWYQGTADAVYQNIYSLEKLRPDLVLILAGDHIYKMNYQKMIDFHASTNADVTVAALRVDCVSAKSFGVMQIDQHNQIVDFQEKPANPCPSPGNPNECLASMGIYLFSSRLLFELLLSDANDSQSSHDFGKDIFPSIINRYRVMAFPFTDENKKTQSYWRDVGTIDSFYAANMDLISIDPLLNLYDRDWPIRTYQGNYPPPKFVFDDHVTGEPERVGTAVDSIVCSGSIISGGRVNHSIIGPQVRINSYANISDSILFDRVQVGRHAKIRRAIIDKDVSVPAGISIGFDSDLDRRRGFVISPDGVVVIGKADAVDPLLQTVGV